MEAMKVQLVCRGRIMLSFYPFSYIFIIFCSDTGLFPPCRRHVLSICREWHLSFLFCYHVQCLTNTSLTPVLGGQSITNAPMITQSTQVPHVLLNTFLGKLHKMLVNAEERCVLLLLLWRPPRVTFKVGL